MKSFDRVLVAVLTLFALGLVGCTDDPVSPVASDAPDPFDVAAEKGIPVVERHGGAPPAGLVEFTAGQRTVECWPYTGTALDSEPSDPVSLVMLGEADPVAIREALLSLDGDRTAYGFPAVYPFDQPWRDCIGGSAQATWEADVGWTGGTIQLTVGDFEPLRFHLRLFAVDDGLTLAAAHFEVLVTGTTDHQVLSWELAEQFVVADLMRAGVLAAPPVPTEVITAAPSFRIIPAMIYNMLPPELTALTGGPPAPVATDVPLDNDGRATVVTLADLPAPTPCSVALTHTAVFDQFVPRPYCSTGPADWLQVTGDVVFEAAVDVDVNGSYRVRTGYEGHLTVVPVNPATGEVLAEPFPACVKGRQSGRTGTRRDFLTASDRMLTHETDGAQINTTRLTVRDPGRDRYRGFVRCIDAEVF
ncbi:MAG: hypothetical protein GY838_01595 [bacterium]|nr:hypothetical protein [bacterium]